jgi:tRNA-dihydrouridine synthase 3
MTASPAPADHLRASGDIQSLTKRHESEKMFGVQICGSKVRLFPSRLIPCCHSSADACSAHLDQQPGQMASAAEIIAKECPDVDFVDCNIGCPIDLGPSPAPSDWPARACSELTASIDFDAVFNSGAGSALMGNPTKLGKILTGMSRALGEVPMTVKMVRPGALPCSLLPFVCLTTLSPRPQRTGIHDNSPNAHKLVPRFVKEWSAGALTIHGRSRQQRYSRLANWQYIKVRPLDSFLAALPS